jgi:hypothetical protein
MQKYTLAAWQKKKKLRRGIWCFPANISFKQRPDDGSTGVQ